MYFFYGIAYTMDGDLAQLHVAELKQICAAENISYPKRLRKQQLIDLIKLHRVDKEIEEGIKELEATVEDQKEIKTEN
jgi:hypothetical protein